MSVLRRHEEGLFTSLVQGAARRMEKYWLALDRKRIRYFFST